MRNLYLCLCSCVCEIVVYCIVDRCSSSDDISFDGDDRGSLSLPLSQSVVQRHRLGFLPLCLPDGHIFFFGRFRFPAGGCKPMSVITTAASIPSCIDTCRREQGDEERLGR